MDDSNSTTIEDLWAEIRNQRSPIAKETVDRWSSTTTKVNKKLGHRRETARHLRRLHTIHYTVSP